MLCKILDDIKKVMQMLKQTKHKLICVFGVILFIFMLGKVSLSAYEINKAQTFINDFQNIYSRTSRKYTFENIKEDISYVRVGRVPSYICHKLVKAYFPYPHRFYRENKYISSFEAKELCYEKADNDLIFQFSLSKNSYAHRLECENNDDCRKGVCRLGFCFEPDVQSVSREL